MRHARALAVLTLGLALSLAPTIADACDHDGPPQPPQPPQVELTASYLYQKVNPALPASWQNSGRQTRFSLRDGHAWLTSIDIANLPAGVCGGGWAVQEDMTVGIGRDAVPVIVDRATGEGVLGWPPIVDARHVDLETLVDVPDCTPDEPEEPEVPEEPETEVLSGGGTAAAATPVVVRPAFAG